ncbi:MAG: hypothetical protein A2Y45_05205 [Tenericutes bacterium GWC2_34_14]|nr:MAG: hypothetical protein A2Z84_02840 [Tenericutes bacterium GWA2_35_7]OHE28352.1 MAG: hypothetical protein A2Y45_05205 [Tenericutes bacterium GWC2_34_14]OHE33740.1 MAG: hypothetical protein A2012_04605 [Tenericutes bacterium GWE2_34_108]OHE37025.1 MAG: hypothetical protein A2Y46_10405 [Tenericutes bacterium GWF1_35_14]OHE37895.1 MAG: hypothetical protein A2Y44_08260 [Tenericutes bacterium GWF2_35_184]OHE41072.1 MAG: hypothetical protein A3K26_01265 [Tenericutes bacterium RIFOXYA12_FULL_35_
MSFLLFLLQSIPILLSRVEWINDIVEVPVYSELEPYRYIPEARLYIDDVWMKNALVVYERNGVEWTFISTVNTSHVRRYSIKYEAKFVDYYITSVHTIVFDVVDLISPEIIFIPEKQIAYGEKLPDFTQGVVLTDNYYDPLDLNVFIDTSCINQSAVGIYDVTYHISDPSGNQVSQTVLFQIKDVKAPTITPLKEVVINVGQTFDWKTFFKIIDDVDHVLRIDLDLSGANLLAIGSYQGSITSTDLSGNQAIQLFQIEVKDLEPPKLMMRITWPDIMVHTEISREHLESYVLSVTDNYDVLEISDLNIRHEIDSNLLGTYPIYYEIKDRSGNAKSLTIHVNVIDSLKPTITLINPLIFDVFSPTPFLQMFFKFEDNYTPDDELIYKITAAPNMNKIGLYPITIEVTDSSKNKRIYQGYIEVVDRIPPEVIQINEIIITDFEKKDVHFFFTYEDQYDEVDDLRFMLMDEMVNYEVIGSYDAYVKVTDTSGNECLVNVIVMIIDIEEPELILKQTSYQHLIGAERPNLESFVDTASDNYDDLGIGDVMITHDIDWETLGVYLVQYELMDQSMNRKTVEFKIIIDDRTPPVITASDLSYSEGDLINLMEGVEVTDNVGVSGITFFPSNLDLNEPGTYIITYIARDFRGNYVMYDRLVTIYPKSDSINVVSYLPVGILTIICGAVFYILYKKG